MGRIYTNIEQLVGHTPLLELIQIEKAYSLQAHIIAKIEGFNPAGSAKDRVAKNMLDNAEKQGLCARGRLLLNLLPGTRESVLLCLPRSGDTVLSSLCQKT